VREDRSDPNSQMRLFEAVLELLDLIAEGTPVVLILEDMHWADRSTRAFTAFLARSLRQERVLLLLSYRSDELHGRHALRPLLPRSTASSAGAGSTSSRWTARSSPRS
jgi:predicted ATPase